MMCNEVGGQDIACKEPQEKCPRCNEDAEAEWCDNGFGPYAVQIAPWHCPSCGWIDGYENKKDKKKKDSLVRLFNWCGLQQPFPSYFEM